jgi:hypothetical protein
MGQCQQTGAIANLGWCGSVAKAKKKVKGREKEHLDFRRENSEVLATPQTIMSPHVPVPICF